MRPGWYAMGPLIVKQHMVFPDGPNAGLAKGLRVVCQERFGEEAVQGINIGQYVSPSHLNINFT